MLTDMESSSEKWQAHPVAMASALVRHDLLISRLVDQFGGRVVKHTGDGFFACFEGGDPLGCALAIQRAFASSDWSDVGGLFIRIGIHPGTADARGGDFFGADVNLASRLLSAAWGGQTLLSREAAEVLTLPSGAYLKDLGPHLLRSFETARNIFQLSHEQDTRQSFPPPMARSIGVLNLPSQATPLVGRESGIRALCSLVLDQGNRLVSVIGSGGMGKTRLALRVAEEVVGEFGSGAVFVPLAPVDRGGQITTAIASSLALKLSEPGSPFTLLTRFLKDREMLLVLDNFEHLTDDAGVLTDLLAGCPLVTVLTTSRERLGLPGETVFELKGLSCPTPGDSDSVAACGAMELFLQKSRAVLPGYSPSESDMKAISGLVSILGGMPLAIELAAGWICLLPPDSILRETTRSLDFLSSAGRGVPERHKSLRAVFEYSWTLLTPTEKHALTRLALFRGEFDTASAMAVASAGLPVLRGLLEKSMIQSRGPGRFQALEVIRQYSVEKLFQSAPDAETALDAHALHFLSWIGSVGVDRPGPGRRGAVIAAKACSDDLRAAWQRALDRRLHRPLLRAGKALFEYLDAICAYSDGEEVFSRLAELVGTAEDASVDDSGRVLCWLGWMLNRRAKYDEADSVLDDALKLLETGGFHAETSRACCGKGLIAYSREEPVLIMDTFEKAHHHALLSCDPGMMALAETGIGLGCYLRAEMADATVHFRKAIAMYEGCGDSMNHPLAYTNLAFAVMGMGGYEEALELINRSIELSEALDDNFSMGSAMRAMGTLELGLGRPGEAAACLRRSIDLYDRIGYEFGVRMSRGILQKIAGDESGLQSG